MFVSAILVDSHVSENNVDYSDSHVIYIVLLVRVMLVIVMLVIVILVIVMLVKVMLVIFISTIVM